MRFFHRSILAACGGFVMLALSARAGEPLVHAAIIDAPRAEVWKAFTTKEGAESWMVAHASIDLKVGGKMLTHYDKNGKLGDPNSIENTILSFDPERMLSIKATRQPAKFPFKAAIKDLWTVIYFEDAGPGKTKVTVVGLGWGNDEESQKMRAFFNTGNDITLKRLQRRFAAKD